MDRLTGHAWLLLAATAGACLCLEALSPPKAVIRAGAAVSNMSAINPQGPKPKHMRPAAAAPVSPVPSASGTTDADPEQASALSPKVIPEPKLISPPVEVKRPPARQPRAVAELDVPVNGQRASASRPQPQDGQATKRTDTGAKSPAFVRALMQGMSDALAPLGLP